jgi:hypothetical protein
MSNAPDRKVARTEKCLKIFPDTAEAKGQVTIITLKGKPAYTAE